jgi:hypothetical protein
MKQAICNQDLVRFIDFVERLQPLDRQVILSYLEDMDAASIGEITGLSARYFNQGLPNQRSSRSPF